MALVGQPATFCYDGFVGDGAPAFMDAGGIAFGYGYEYQPDVLEEGCLLGGHAHGWELPIGDLSPEAPGSVNAFGGHDVGWTTPAGRLSSSSASSSVLTFDGQGEGNCPAAAWMDAADQLSYSPSTAAAATAPTGGFTFEGCGGDGRTAASPPHKRPRAHAQAQQGITDQESTTLPKKQCGGDRKSAIKPTKTSATTSSAAKDPQSDAAKTRRERIGERLRVLQELVPNGSKVDMVTMLDKAITYVKFMQLQLTVLETDAFWPAQGGEAPEISQVKAALDAIILSSSQQPRQWS